MKSTIAGIEIESVEFADLIAQELAKVEELLMAELSSGESFLTEAATYLAKAGGKRFRPVFALLAAHCSPEPTNPHVITSATVCELIHLATLYHDDVMDEATMRRGTPAANARWTNSIAILAGDFLFARASRLVSTMGPDSVRIIADTFAELVTGQMRETVGAQGADPVEHYLKVVWEKTGSLIAAAGRFGAMSAGADSETVERLSRIGDAMGTAFQISDDIIDLASSSGDSGKTPGTDLREGVHTLPVLYALENSRETTDLAENSARLRELLLNVDGSRRILTVDAEVAEAQNLVINSAGMVQAKATLRGYADTARTELAQLRDTPARAALESLVEFTVARVG